MTNEIYDESLRYWGLSTVPKPQNPAYYLYVEVDTGKQFAWDLASKTWQEYVPAGFAPSIDAELAQAQGFISQNFNRGIAQTAAAMTSQRAYFGMIFLQAGAVVSNAHLAVNTVGASTTNGQMGLYALDGTRLAETANVGTAWESTGLKTHPFVTPFTVLESGAYYVAALAEAGTPPTLIRAGGYAVGGTAAPSGARNYAQQSSLATLPATATFQDGSADYWYAVS